MILIQLAPSLKVDVKQSMVGEQEVGHVALTQMLHNHGTH